MSKVTCDTLVAFLIGGLTAVPISLEYIYALHNPVAMSILPMVALWIVYRNWEVIDDQ